MGSTSVISKVICSVDKELVSKETVVLYRWGSGDECLVLLTRLIKYFGHREMTES